MCGSDPNDDRSRRVLVVDDDPDVRDSLVVLLGTLGFEQLARYGVENWNMDEFCWMSISFLGFVWLIRWRGKSKVVPRVADERDAVIRPQWRGVGGNA